MPRSPSYTDEDVSKMLRLLQDGCTTPSVAHELGFSVKVVISAIKKHTGLTTRQYRTKYCDTIWTENDIIEFKRLLRIGLSAEEIGNKTGFSEGQVRYAIKRTEGMSISELRRTLMEEESSVPGNGPRPLTPEQKDQQRIALRGLRLPSKNSRIGRPCRTYQKKCPICGTSFESKKTRQTFCSLNCASKSRVTKSRVARPVLHKSCEHCGREFDTKRPEQKYCGDSCRIARISHDKTVLSEIPCEYCDKLFRPAQQSQRFCSRDCANKGKKPSTNVYGDFKLEDATYVRFESSYELVFLLYASQHRESYRQIRRCDVSIEYDFHGKRHRYYPDFVVENERSETLIIEIKSSGTILRDPKVESKLTAAAKWCRDNQMRFVFLSDEDDAFIEMCEYVANTQGLDVARHVSKGKKLLTISKHCLECGRTIPRGGKGIRAYLKRTFCSEKCRSKSKHGKKQRLPTSSHICPQCGQEFHNSCRDRKFCSKACYTASQQVLVSRECPVCGNTYRPKSSTQATCGVNCGIVFRAANRKGVAVNEYLESAARAKALPKRTCSVCGDVFIPLSQSTKKCPSCRKASVTHWSFENMVGRLKEIRAYLDGRIPTYSEIYKRTDLRHKFNSCSLAGAIYRFNQKHGLSSYDDFVSRHLGWKPTRRLVNKEEVTRLVKDIVKQYGGMPTSLAKLDNCLGIRGTPLKRRSRSRMD